jgi:uncharacterized protein YeaO (DUF488 family)
MVNVKHFMDAIELQDGLRVWVEPVGLTRDLRAWCGVDSVAPQLGPPRELADWYEEHNPQDAYEFFRGSYHEHLSRESHLNVLRQLAWQGTTGNITLLHQGSHPSYNTAAALHEFLSELSAYCPPYACTLSSACVA